MKSQRWLVGVFIILILAFSLYSYTQVDLNLTLSSHPLYQNIQKQLTYIGYFNRPLSGTLFLGLIFALFIFYVNLLKTILQNKFRVGTLKACIGITFLLVFAYPAFSHDLFNYMFDARVVTVYGLDPHFFKALDFPLDQWTRFMRWTHRYYPYGPGWLWLTLLPSYLGMGKFVLTLGLYKLMFLLFHLGNIWFIGQLAGKERKWGAVVFFALNPLVLTESLVSPHNEVVMLFFALLAIYLFFRNRAVGAVLSLLASVGIKYISGVLFPLFWLIKPQTKRFFIWVFWAWTIALIPLVITREPYSWYAVPLVGIAALTQSKFIKILTVSISLGLMLRYLPFLWWGEYTLTTQTWQIWVLFVGTLISWFTLLHLWPISEVGN